MFNKNEIWTGFLFGIILPVAGFLVLMQMFSLLEIKGAASGAGLSADFRERTLAIVAVALNLIPMQIYRNRRWDKAIRGIVIATSVLALVWVVRYGVKLM